jgi:class 3 adenylate cyclase/tetratricopeptide (TPR) repeat protein
VTAASSPTTSSAELVSFVPRLTIDWLRDHPDDLWREIEGTVSFIDISGFTAMSEKLSSQGRAGAEEVTEVMNATFAALLAVAYAQGGGLLKFGGDALLLLYEGDDHASRAVRAAFEMRSTLRAIGRPRTSAGAVQLKMHAGIHSGTFNFFLVGDSHRELLITGPSASATVAMEAASEAGEILLSEATAALVDPGALGDEKEGGRLLLAAPEVRGSVEPLPSVEGVPVERAVPSPLRAQLLEVGPLEGEHRHAAIAFIRFSGTDEIIQTEGAAAAAEALAVLVRAIEEAADEHRVTFLESDIDRDGGRIVLVSGAPQTFGDDEERMLRTVRAIVDAGLPLPVHIGVSEGRVFTGQVGASFRRTYTVLGDTAALAARLMARAREDEIWVSEGALTRGGASFVSTALEPLTLKGKSEPVQAFVLGELLATHERAGQSEVRGELPFFDRERERAVLGASVAPVRMGFGTLVELVGEPGIGKSRLAQELRENCTDMRQIELRCEQYESSTPYHPFRPFLRSLLDVDLNGGSDHNREVVSQRLEQIDPELVPWAPLLAAPLDVEIASTPEVNDLDPSFWRARLHGVMGTLLGQILDSPTLMVFDDVHWMDDASSELLRYLGTQLPTKPWLACTTRRPGDDGFAAATGTPPLPALTLRLEPLPEDDARALAVAAAGDRRLTDEEVAALMERAAGNPLFLRELASVGDKTDVAEELPDTVETLVATRIDQLGPGDRALLRWASVLGVSFSGALIAEVLEDDPNVAAASDAWDRLGEFVERDPDVAGAFRFRHALIRDAAYEGLSFKRRRELHGRVAEVIEQRHGARMEEAAELLSLHFYRAQRWPETWRYSVEAGRRAEEKYANVEAAAFFERALGVAKRVEGVDSEHVARIWEALGDARVRMSAFEAAGEAFRESRAAWAGGAVEEARLMQKEAMIPLRLARYPQALRRLTQALRTLVDVEGDAAAAQRARLLGWYATVLQYQRRPRMAIEWCEKAVAAATGRPDAQDALAHAYFILDWAYAALGRLDEAVYSERAIEIFEELGDLDRLAWVLNNFGGLTYLRGRWDEALELAERARTTFLRIGDESQASIAALNIAEVRSDQGRADEADPVFREVLDIRRAAGNPVKIAEAWSFLGRHLARIGEHEEAQAVLEEARGLFEAEGDAEDLLRTDAWLSDCHVLGGNTAAGLELASKTLERAESLSGVLVVVTHLHRTRGWAYLQAGDVESARTALAESLRIARGDNENFGIMSADYEVGLTLNAVIRLREMAGEPTAEITRERDDIFERLGVLHVPEPPLPALGGGGGSETKTAG